MNRPHRITRLMVLVAALVAGACTSKQEIRTAKSSAYDADFAIVYSQALEAVRGLYPNTDEDPTRGVIQTAWHEVTHNASQDDPRATQNTNRALGGTTGAGVFNARPGSLRKRTFIRFDVRVAGGRPWRIRVIAKASEWDPGNAQPTELRGAAIPQWLPGRRDALVVAIHRRLSQYAVHVEPEVEVVEDPVPDVDRALFGEIPAPAAEVAAKVVEAIEGRDVRALRAQLADDVTWSFGAAGDADTAIAMWQADPEAMAALARVLREGCRLGEGEVVTCPPAATEQPGYVDWRVTIEKRGAGWKLTAFVRGD